MLELVKDFPREQPRTVKKELNGIVRRLEPNGYLQMPGREME